MTKKNIKLTCYCAIGLFLGLRLFFETINAISYSVVLAALIDVAYDKYLWRFNPLEKTPRIYGTYDDVSYSTFNGGYEYKAVAKIKQTLSSITVHEEIEGSGYTESITAALVPPAADGVWKLYYTYRTYPEAGKKDDMHEGTVILYVKNKTELAGTYFTNRTDPTQGNMRLYKRSK